MDPRLSGKRGSDLALLLFFSSAFFFSLLGCGGGAGHAKAPAAYGPGSYATEEASDSATSGGATKVGEAPTPARDESKANVVAVVARGRQSEPAAKAPPPQQPASTPQARAPASPPAKPDPTLEAARDRELIIYTARVTMAVYQVDQGVSAVEKIAQETGGYLASKQDRMITIRVPRARFQETLARVDKIGDVLHRDVQAQDVTDEHLDLEIRIKNARAMRARLQDLLAKASVKEALEIEKELHRVTDELERLEGKLKLLTDKIAYSTITVAFAPRGAQIRAASVRLPFPWLTEVGLPSLLQLNEEK